MFPVAHTSIYKGKENYVQRYALNFQHRLPGWVGGVKGREEVMKGTSLATALSRAKKNVHMCYLCVWNVCMEGALSYIPGSAPGLGSDPSVGPLWKHPVSRDQSQTLPSVCVSTSNTLTHLGVLIFYFLFFATFSRKSSPSKRPTKGVSNLLSAFR